MTSKHSGMFGSGVLRFLPEANLTPRQSATHLPLGPKRWRSHRRGAWGSCLRSGASMPPAPRLVGLGYAEHFAAVEFDLVGKFRDEADRKSINFWFAVRVFFNWAGFYHFGDYMRDQRCSNVVL
jgi:hypothetical protein